MEPLIPVGSSHREWWFVVLVALSILLVLCGGALVLVHHEAGFPVLISGGVISFVALLSAVVIAARKVSVQITPDGFIVRDRYGEREYTDMAVLCASLQSQSHYTNGERRATTRTFEVWVETEEGSAERVKMRNRFAVGGSDPLGLLIDRILGHLYDQASSVLSDGESFEGQGWSLNSREFAWAQKRQSVTIPVGELTAADVFDSELCVWRSGNDEPVVRIPMSAANAPVLLTLLRERVVAPTAGEAETSGGLGRVLFERKPSSGSTVALWIMPIGAASLFLGGVLMALLMKRFEPAIVLGVVSAVLTQIWLVPLSQHVSLRCHEHGVSRRWLRREQRLRYSEIDLFTYSAIRQYVKGVYSGTSFTLTFASNAAGKLTYTKTLRNADDELDRLRDRVGRILAERMAKQFGTGSTVSWGDALRFFPEGLEYRASGFLRRKAPVMIPFDQIAGIDITDGQFRLWRTGQKGHAVKESVAQPNFFPGYFLLLRLLASESSKPAPAETATAHE